jgi:GNAT superfamily N-acetyltransferase
MELELREVTPEVLDELRTQVVLPPEQAEWVGGSVDDSLQEAAGHPEAKPWPRGVYRDGVPVGFVMLSWDVTPDPPRIIGPWFLWKLIVDERHQGRGLGREIVMAMAGLVREQGGTELLTSFVDEPGGPEDFYLRLGFVPTGEVDNDGEPVLSLSL